MNTHHPYVICILQIKQNQKSWKKSHTSWMTAFLLLQTQSWKMPAAARAQIGAEWKVNSRRLAGPDSSWTGRKRRGGLRRVHHQASKVAAQVARRIRRTDAQRLEATMTFPQLRLRGFRVRKQMQRLGKFFNCERFQGDSFWVCSGVKYRGLCVTV